MLLYADSYRSFLSEELMKRLRHNPRYSQRAFAQFLGLSPGELSEILRGKRRLSLKSAFRVARRLELTEKETQYFLKLVGGSSDERPAIKPTARQLALDIFHTVSDWYCFALVNLVQCESFRGDPAWIAKRLGISPLQAKLALQRLLRIGLLELRENKVCVSQEAVFSPDNIPSEAIRNYHRQILHLAADALDAQGITEREISGVSFAVDRGDLKKMKQDVAEFLDQMAQKYGGRGRKTEVYHLEAALFRLTHSKNGAKCNA